MPLSYHHTVDAPSTHGIDSKSVTATKLNANFDLCEANDQEVEDRFEDTFYDAFGSGILSGLQPTPGCGGGLSVDVTAGVALIGYAISISATSVAITASQTTGYIYLRQNGTFYDAGGTATPPSGVSSVLYATYSSDGSDCLTVVLNSCGIQLDQIDADVAGALSVGTIKYGVVPSDRDFWIAGVVIMSADPGDLSESGDNDNVLVDVHVGDAGSAPVTIFTDQGNRPTVVAESGVYQTDSGGAPDVRFIEAGQVFRIDVDGAPTNSDGLSVVIYGRWCDIA